MAGGGEGVTPIVIRENQSGLKKQLRPREKKAYGGSRWSGRLYEFLKEGGDSEK